jgi:gamma-glutamyl AIG2-like cyclotransferase
MTTHHLYAYGTLQLPPVISLIVGRTLGGIPATLSGYARYKIADRVYPAIVEASGGSVSGVLYQGLDAAELGRLDAYEGPLYERRDLPVEVGGALVDAGTYVLKPEHAHRLSREGWDLAQFERDHLESYLARISATYRAP